jgi:cytochrome c peroxidase
MMIRILFGFSLLLGGVWCAMATAGEMKLPGRLPSLLPPDAKRAELGRDLFFDRRLSGDGTMSCAACHIPEESFADSQPLSGAYPTNKHWRHTQSLINVAYLQTFFWDGRSYSLEDQVKGVIHSSFEMNLNLDYLVAKLREIPEYKKLFIQAFGGEPTRENIAAALAEFERTLVVNDSPFDRYLAGDKKALSDSALRGARIFFGERGGCSRCHSGPLLSDQRFHNIGVGETPDLRNDPQRRATRNFFLGEMGVAPMDRDPGRFAVTKNPADLGAFRTPPLRQVAETAPYMHNGSLKTLEEVIDFYNRGGGDDPNKSKLIRSLNLSEQEKADLIAFLRSLSGTLPEVKAPPPPGY